MANVFEARKRSGEKLLTNADTTTEIGGENELSLSQSQIAIDARLKIHQSK